MLRTESGVAEYKKSALPPVLCWRNFSAFNFHPDIYIQWAHICVPSDAWEIMWYQGLYPELPQDIHSSPVSHIPCLPSTFNLFFSAENTIYGLVFMLENKMQSPNHANSFINHYLGRLTQTHMISTCDNFFRRKYIYCKKNISNYMSKGFVLCFMLLSTNQGNSLIHKYI